MDGVFRGTALATNDARLSLAKMAAGETGMGVKDDKKTTMVEIKGLYRQAYFGEY